ncbi:hydroxymethylglutaryl-CoA lyase [Ferroacidibacillus organovorans]|uniref:Hydroxymethylglutaryl-CoA lyase n=1 Tax=Ferroacidibacillus organovorans TaxID=1765683 RepID=A0A1V4EW85_9BACL|nr:hydroxymethylglutaryl-CoA lyase [Ferroacidibacillus organovorans]OPG17183.1 hydroxymethylglutaryl-CoA lyase [Ferroacidibacillus organovorans]
MRPTIPVRDNGTPLPRQVEMIDVSPRDGLQNEPVLVSVDKKKELILRLSKAGFRRIETTSFVHPKWVLQMADAEAIVSYCNQLGITYITLTPNLKALERALAADVPQIAVFIGASNAFNQKNVNRTTDESLAECEPLFARAKKRGVFVRAYVSTVWHCPYQGSVSYDEVDHVVKRFVDLGADEIDLGDTNGQAHPQEVFERCQSLKEAYPEMPFVGHFHDTSKLALANVYAALLAGIDRFDASTGGLGGCPFSPGATGNVATEDVLAMLDKMGIHTGIDLHAETVSFARSLSTRI